MKRWFVIHTTVSFGRRITLAPDPTFTVHADTEERALDLARVMGWDRMIGFRLDGVRAA